MTHTSDADRLLKLLPNLVKAEQARRRTDSSSVAKQLGMTISSVWRISTGKGLPDARGLLLLLGWLRVPGWWFTGELPDAIADAYQRGRDDMAAEMRAVLDTDRAAP